MPQVKMKLTAKEKKEGREGQKARKNFSARRQRPKMIHATSVRVSGFSVILKLSNGASVERDFGLVRGGVLDRIHRRNGLDPRVRIKHGALVWPGEIDFELDNVLWGWPRRKGRPLSRALVGIDGSLAPAPIVTHL